MEGAGTYLCVCCGACLAEAVALLDGHLQPSIHSIHEFFSQRGGARVEHAQGAEVVFVHDRVFPQKQDDGWHDVGEGDLLVLDNGAELLEVEFGHDDEFPPAVHRLVD